MIQTSHILQYSENIEQNNDLILNAIIEICRSSKSHHGIWGHIRNNRELLSMLQNEYPEFLEVTFIEEWIAAMDIFFRRIQLVLQIPKPPELSIKKWSGSIDVWEDSDGRSNLEFPLCKMGEHLD